MPGFPHNPYLGCTQIIYRKGCLLRICFFLSCSHAGENIYTKRSICTCGRHLRAAARWGHILTDAQQTHRGFRNLRQSHRLRKTPSAGYRDAVCHFSLQTPDNTNVSDKRMAGYAIVGCFVLFLHAQDRHFDVFDNRAALIPPNSLRSLSPFGFCRCRPLHLGVPGV